MTGTKFVVLGLAEPRAAWFREVGKWASTAAVPADFVKCLSVEEVRARLRSGRRHSCLLADGGVNGLDRDTIQLCHEFATSVLVVTSPRSPRNWTSLGANGVVAADFGPHELTDLLEQHCTPVASSPDNVIEPAADVPGTRPIGRLVAVTGGSGAGASTMAMALAQGLGDDPRYTELTLLTDLALRADMAMLHDATDIVPGIQEVVEAHRAGRLTHADLRSMIYECPERGYHLLLGLRRQRDWTMLRPRAVDASIDTLLRSYRMIIADVDADVEGETEVGSVDIEERNVLARSAFRRAHIVIVVGAPHLKGIHDLVRVIGDLTRFGVAAGRLLPVINRAPRSVRRRAELTRAIGELLAGAGDGVAAPIHVPERRAVEDAVRDGGRLPPQLTRPVAAAIVSLATSELLPDPLPANSGFVPIQPGALGHFDDSLPEAG